jgi:hypothetical protein
VTTPLSWVVRMAVHKQYIGAESQTVEYHLSVITLIAIVQTLYKETMQRIITKQPREVQETSTHKIILLLEGQLYR